MDTGNPTMVKQLSFEEPKPKTKLMVTYWQTQASNAHGKNPEYFHYNDLKSLPGRFNEQGLFVKALADQERYSDVISQLDSLPSLIAARRFFQQFDLIILDEIESILSHLSASTFWNRHLTVHLLVEILRQAKSNIALDGHLGQQTFDFLTMNGIKCGPVVINKFLPERPLEFEFPKGKEDHEYWQSTLLTTLLNGENCIVYLMSSNDLLEELVIERKVLSEAEILKITEDSCGKVKKGLQHVNEQWMKRLVMLSPTVEAAVDFNKPWFARAFLYICLGSTTPRGLDQMKSRVRKLENPSVMCFVQQGIALPVGETRPKCRVTIKETDAGTSQPLKAVW
jgi:hypothetical protein